MPATTTTLSASELLAWALRVHNLGVFYAGYNLGGRAGDVWCCFGCDAQHSRDHGHRDDFDARTFPHSEGCKYVAACEVSGVSKRRSCG